MNNKYRLEIDGLRAIAVISVILFHMFPKVVSGGYIGVDIFFVISGYLITNLINQEIYKTNNFNFKEFYIRRAKRLIPAILTTVTISVFTSLLILSPQHLQKFGESIIYAIFSISNVYFYKESGYFDEDAYTKPLLHTWSLSVEEQFYFILPIIIFLCFKQKLFNKKLLFKLCLLVIFVISLLSNFLYQNDKYLIFYLIPFRAFEFTIGASILFIKKIDINSEKIINIVLVTCLITLLTLLFIFDENTLFPTYNALIPCLSTSIIIFISQYNSFISDKILKNSYITKIGLQSYSLYLVHWPIIVYYKYINNNYLSLLDSIIILFITFISSYLLYTYIEKPIRNISFKNKYLFTRFISSIVLSLLILLFVGSFLSVGNKYSNYKTQKERSLQDFTDYNAYAGSNLKREFSREQKIKILVIGDSQARDIINMLKENKKYNKSEVVYIYISAKCQPIFRIPEYLYVNNYKREDKEMCLKGHKLFNSKMKLNNVKDANIIILSADWQLWSSLLVNKISENYTSLNDKAKLYIIGPKTLDINPLLSYHKKVYSLKASPDKEKLKMENYFIKSLKYNKNIEYLSFYNFICNNNKKDSCKLFNPNNDLLMFDESHLTLEGSKYLSNNLDFLFSQ